MAMLRRPPPPFPKPDALRDEPVADLATRIDRLERDVADLRRVGAITAPQAEQQARALFRILTQPALAALTQRDSQHEQALIDAIARIDRLEAALKAHRAEMARAAQHLAGNVRGVRAETLVGVGLAVLTLAMGAAAILLR